MTFSAETIWNFIETYVDSLPSFSSYNISGIHEIVTQTIQYDAFCTELTCTKQ